MNDSVKLPVTNEYGYYEIRLESIGGLGANLCGKLLGELGALYLKLNALSFSSYGSEKRGSPVKAYIRWCEDNVSLQINSPVTHPHLLGIFHEGLISSYPVLSGISKHTQIVLNTPLSATEAADKYKIPTGTLHCIDALSIAMDCNPVSIWLCWEPSSKPVDSFPFPWQKPLVQKVSEKNTPVS